MDAVEEKNSKEANYKNIALILDVRNYKNDAYKVSRYSGHQIRCLKNASTINVIP